jgi:hypothetical protein
MRALGLCLSGALCLILVGCNTPGQSPVTDPFAPYMGPTTVTPPGTNLTAPSNPFGQGSPAQVAPQSKKPSNRYGATSTDVSEEVAQVRDSDWQPQAKRVSLASDEGDDGSTVEAADAEMTSEDESGVTTADFQEEIAEEAPRENPTRSKSLNFKANRSSDQDGEVTGTLR